MNLRSALLGQVARLLRRGPVLVRIRTRDASNAIVYRMSAGVPGDINRTGAAFVSEPNVVSPSVPPLAYGVPVTMGADGIQPIGAGAVAANVYGLLVRPFPFNAQTTTGFFGSTPLGTPAVPPTTGVVDVLKSGYMTVKLYGPTAALAGGAVFIRIANAGAGEIVGGIEAAADGGNTIQIGAANTTYFRGPADADGNTEIAFNV